jgi:rRNA maturation endonuclease Nob1
MTKKEPVKEKNFVCSHCGSEDVRRDAWAEWDVRSQKWHVSAVFDHAFCESCGGETSLQTVTILSLKGKRT